MIYPSLKNERLFGVDGEMSGADIMAGHRLIQIGVAVDTDADGRRLAEPDLFVSMIGWTEEELVWDEQAERVHHIPREVVLQAPPAYEVDEALCEWLFERGSSNTGRRRQVMVGFNVGVFDGPFIAQALPKSKEFFARRYADLNPLAFVLAGAGLINNGEPMTSAGWKRRFRTHGLEYAQRTGRMEGEHDAGTDALQALGAWRYTESLLAAQQDELMELRRRERRARLSETKDLDAC